MTIGSFAELEDSWIAVRGLLFKDLLYVSKKCYLDLGFDWLHLDGHFEERFYGCGLPGHSHEEHDAFEALGREFS